MATGKRRTQSTCNLVTEFNPKDEKLAEFVTTTLLSKKHPAYTSTKIAFATRAKDNSDAVILLPALEMPVFPLDYSEAFNKLYDNHLKTKAHPGVKRHKRSIQAKPSVQKIDGIPYNPQEFRFPTSTKERQKLGELAELLGMGPFGSNEKNLKRKLSVALPTDFSKKGLRHRNKSSRERIRAISCDPEYKAQLAERIEEKLGKDLKARTMSNGFFRTGASLLRGKTLYSTRTTLMEERTRMREKVEEILEKKKEVHKYMNEKLDKEMGQLISAKNASPREIVSKLVKPLKKGWCAERNFVKKPYVIPLRLGITRKDSESLQKVRNDILAARKKYNEDIF